MNELLRPVMAGHGNLGRAYRPPGSPGFIVKAGGVTLHVNPYEPPSKYGMGKSYTMSQVEFLGLSEWGPVWARYGEALPDSWPEWRKAVMETLEIKPSDGPKLAETPKWPVELVAKLEKKKYRLDEPILYQLELINRLDEPVIVQTYNEVPRVTSDVSGDLQPRPPSESLRSTWREIAPGGSAVVRENTDLRDDALLIKPGRYTFKGASTVWLYPSELKSDFEKSGSSDDYAASEALRAKHPMPSRNYSAPVAFELKGGEPRPEDAAARRWLDRHPEKSWLIELDAPAVVGGPTVISTTIGSGLYIDLTVFHLHLGAESAPSEKDPVYLSRTYNVELLGKSAQWGPVWAQYEPKVDERWPEWREAAREVWEIAPDEAPESTP